MDEGGFVFSDWMLVEIIPFQTITPESVLKVFYRILFLLCQCLL